MLSSKRDAIKYGEKGIENREQKAGSFSIP